MNKTNKDFLISISYSLVLPAILYFILKLFQSNYHIISANIDNIIPFIPYFIYLYILFFPFIVIVLYIIFVNDKKRYYQGITAIMLGLIITDIIFLIYPTIIYRPEINSSIDFLTKALINITYYFDTPAINCFPSIHCLLCFQVSLMILLCKNANIKNKIITIIISFLIITSTVFIKQHYFYDIIGAFIIFIISNVIISKITTKFMKKVDI